MNACLICRRDVTGDEDDCATRKTDGAFVCPECLVKVRAGNRDTLDKLYDARVVRT